MRVLQCTKRSVTLLAAACVALTACGDSGPEAPFNPSGTTEDIAAVHDAFSSDAFASFSTFSLYFDAAIGTAPLVTGSASAFNFRRRTKDGEFRAAATRNARRVAALLQGRTAASFSASSASIPPEVAGKTFEYNGTEYVAGDRTGAPSNGVRFVIYAVNPITMQPVNPLQEVGYVQLTDLSGSTTQAARVVVVSNNITYLDYTATASATATGSRITVAGYVTNGEYRANVNLRSTVTEEIGLSLLYSIDVPQRDVSIDLTMTTSGLDPETATVSIDLGMSGPNGTVSMSGEFTDAGGTITVRVNGDVFANVVSSGGGEPVITGADGQPLSQEDELAFQQIFGLTGEAFITFEVMLLPVGFFMTPTAA
jgi:hypothetical protein